MESTSNWQEAAVALFERATVRSSDDARQMHGTLGWLRRITPVETLRGKARWLPAADQADFKRMV